MHSLYKGVFIFGLAVMVSSLPAPNPKCQTQTLDEAKKSERALANFAVNIFKNISAQLNNKNDIISPVSVALTLAMLENGADGETRQQIQQQLIDSGATEQVLSVYSALEKQLSIDQSKTKLQIANAIYHDKTIQLKQDYQKSTQQCLVAEVQEVDFKKQLEQTRQKINKYISDKTQKKIPELFKQDVLTSDSEVVLANAVYFKASWQKAFQKQQTKQGPFYQQGCLQNPEQVDYMTDEGQYRHLASDKFQVLELPYGQGDLSMYVLLPNDRDGIKDLQKQLTGDQLQSIIDKVAVKKVQVQLPKFSIRKPSDLKPVLNAMGLDKLFGQRADFSRLSDQKLEISQAVHEAYIKIDEDGTEAAAATGSDAVNQAVVGGDPTKFVADHAFIYAIIHKPTHGVVFIGRVDDVHEKAMCF